MEASSTTTKGVIPPGLFTNFCLAPPEDVVISGSISIKSIVQQDGSTANYVTASGQGLALITGANYTMNEEEHIWIMGPGQTTLTFTWYQKLIRSGETASTLGGDDFYFRIYMGIPVGPGGVPNMNALNTNTSGFDCR